jgi:hypothetical protein
MFFWIENLKEISGFTPLEMMYLLDELYKRRFPTPFKNSYSQKTGKLNNPK